MVKLGSDWAPTEKVQQEQAVLPGWWARDEGGSKAAGAMAWLTSGRVPQYLNKESRAGLGTVSQPVGQQASPKAARQVQGQARKSWSAGQVWISEAVARHPQGCPQAGTKGNCPALMPLLSGRGQPLLTLLTALPQTARRLKAAQLHCRCWPWAQAAETPRAGSDTSFLQFTLLHTLIAARKQETKDLLQFGHR